MMLMTAFHEGIFLMNEMVAFNLLFITHPVLFIQFSYVVIQKRPKVLRAKTEHLTHEIAPNRTQRTVDPRLTDAENDIMEMVGSVLDGAPVKNTRKSTGSTTMTTKSKQQIELELENHAVYSSNAFKKWGIWLESQAYLYQHITDARNPNKIRGVIQDNATSIDPTPLMVLQRFVGTEREDVQHVLDELTDELDWDDYTPPLYREEWGRIIRYLATIALRYIAVEWFVGG